MHCANASINRFFRAEISVLECPSEHFFCEWEGEELSERNPIKRNGTKRNTESSAHKVSNCQMAQILLAKHPISSGADSHKGFVPVQALSRVYENGYRRS